MSGLGISLSHKFLLQLLTSDGNLRLLAHDGVNSTIPSIFALTQNNIIYGTPASNQWARNGLGTITNFKRLIGLKNNTETLNFITFSKDVRTFKDSMLLTSPWTPTSVEDPSLLSTISLPATAPIDSDTTSVIRFGHSSFAALFATKPACCLENENADTTNFSSSITNYQANPTLLRLPAHISMEVHLALILSTIHSTWGAQYPLLKPIQLLSFHCTESVGFGSINPTNNVAHNSGLQTTALDKAVISIPPWFSTSQRISILHAFRLAQLPLVDLVHDSFATLHTYTLSRLHNEAKHVIFFDFGHSQTTLSLVHFNPSALSASILDYEAHMSLGVRDIVDIVFKKIKTKFATTCKQHNTTVEEYFAQNNQKNLIAWWNIIHKSVEKLTSATQITLEFPCILGNGDDYAFHYTREQFDQDITPLFTQHMFKLLSALLSRHVDLITNEAIQNSAITLEYTGAGCRIPIFQRLLADFTFTNPALTAPISGFKTTATVNPDEASSRGCAFITSSKQSDNVYCYTSHPQQWKFTDHTLRPHHQFNHLTTLYEKLEANPQFNHQLYVDTHQFTLLRQRDLKLNAFLSRCNAFETMIYENDSMRDNEKKAETMDSYLEWLSDTSSGDYRYVDVCIAHLTNVLAYLPEADTDGAKWTQIEQQKTNDIASLNEMLYNATIEQNLTYESAYLDQMSKFQAATQVWDTLGGENSQTVLKWIGTDYYQQVTSFSTPRLQCSPKGGSGTTGNTSHLDRSEQINKPVEKIGGPSASGKIASGELVPAPLVPSSSSLSQSTQPTKSAPSAALVSSTPVTSSQPTPTHTSSVSSKPLPHSSTSPAPTPTQKTPTSPPSSNFLSSHTAQQHHHQHQPTQSPSHDDLNDLYASSFILGGPIIAPALTISPVNSPVNTPQPTPQQTPQVKGTQTQTQGTQPQGTSKVQQMAQQMAHNTKPTPHTHTAPSPAQSTQLKQSTQSTPKFKANTSPNTHSSLSSSPFPTEPSPSRKHTISLDTDPTLPPLSDGNASQQATVQTNANSNEDPFDTFIIEQPLSKPYVITPSSPVVHSLSPHPQQNNFISKPQQQQQQQQQPQQQSAPTTTIQKNNAHSPSPSLSPQQPHQQPLQSLQQPQPQPSQQEAHLPPPSYAESTSLGHNPTTVNANNANTTENHDEYVMIQPSVPVPVPVADQTQHTNISSSTSSTHVHPKSSTQDHGGSVENNTPGDSMTSAASAAMGGWFNTFQSWMQSNPTHSTTASPHSTSTGSDHGHAVDKSHTVCTRFQNTGDCIEWTNKTCPYSHDLCDADFFGTCPANDTCPKVHLTAAAKKAIRGGQ